MTYKIEQIQGIDSQHTQKLGAAGVATTGDLLSKGASVEGRNQLATATGIPAAQILTLANQADLMRVTGVGSEFGQLLESAGVDTVKELATRKADNLTESLARVSKEKNLTRAVPPVATVSGWIDQAQKLQPMLTH